MRSDDLNLTDSDSFGSMESLDSVEASVDEKASINNTVDQKAVDHNTDNHKITEAFIAPHVCLVGATNVGKSTLFNKLVGFRSAIVCDRPGVTVDFHEKTSLSSPLGFPVKIVDTGGVRLLKNDRRVKKGPNREAEKKNETLLEETELAAKKAIDRSDVLFFVVDGTRDPGPVEDEIAQWLRRNAPCSLENIAILVNKSDVKKFDPHIFYSLGFETVIPVSAEHSRGLNEVWEFLEEKLADKAKEYAEWKKQLDERELELSKRKPSQLRARSADDEPRVMVIGRPNVGKSTLLNSLLGEDRFVTSDVAGTTRDNVSADFRYEGVNWELVDSAGLRRPGRRERGVEWVAGEKLKEMSKRADVALLVIDSVEGVTDLDAAIAGMAIENGLSVILCCNKWDKVKGDAGDDIKAKLERSQDLKFRFLSFCPMIRISALTGRGVEKVPGIVKRLMKERCKRVPTGELNRIFDHKIREFPHPQRGGRSRIKFYYITQVDVAPPQFVLFSNLDPKDVHFSFKRHVVNTLRDAFSYKGTPVELRLKKRFNSADKRNFR